MRYYRIRQDRHLRNRITFQDLEGCPNLVFDKETIRDFKRSSVLYVQGDKNSQYPDLFESPVLLISEKLFDIIRYYDTEVEFRIAVLETEAAGCVPPDGSEGRGCIIGTDNIF